MCEDKGSDRRFPKAALFILQKEGKISENGMKIGFDSKLCLEKRQTVTGNGNTTNDQGNYQEIADTGMYDISTASEEIISQIGLKSITFRSLFDSTTRWWFKEQP